MSVDVIATLIDEDESKNISYGVLHYYNNSDLIVVRNMKFKKATKNLLPIYIGKFHTSANNK